MPCCAVLRCAALCCAVPRAWLRARMAIWLSTSVALEVSTATMPCGQRITDSCCARPAAKGQAEQGGARGPGP